MHFKHSMRTPHPSGSCGQRCGRGHGKSTDLPSAGCNQRCPPLRAATRHCSSSISDPQTKTANEPLTHLGTRRLAKQARKLRQPAGQGGGQQLLHTRQRGATGQLLQGGDWGVFTTRQAAHEQQQQRPAAVRTCEAAAAKCNCTARCRKSQPHYHCVPCAWLQFIADCTSSSMPLACRTSKMVCRMDSAFRCRGAPYSSLQAAEQAGLPVAV